MKYKLAFVVCLWPWSVLAHYICNLYGSGPCSCSEEMTKWPRRTAALRTRPRRSGTRPAKPDVQMTRSSSVGGAVFRGICGYPPSKEDKNCSHLHLHVYRMYCGNASKPNQSACCYTVTSETWEVFPSNGSYVLAFHLARHTQEPHRTQQKV